MRPIPRMAAGAVAALLSLGGAAAEPVRDLVQGVHASWRIEEGLPQNAVIALAQTRDGYLWLATQEGLARFDGVRFTVYDGTNTDALHSNFITALHEDRAGALWVGTARGLARLAGGVFEAYGRERGLAPEVIAAFWSDADGSVWVGTDGRGVARWDGRRFAMQGRADGLADDAVRSLWRSADGTLWAGTRRGLSRLAGGRWTALGPRQGCGAWDIRALKEDAAGRLWIGTTAGLAWYDGRRCRMHPGLRGERVLALHEDRDGALWIGASGGLVQLHRGRLRRYGAGDGLGRRPVLCLLEDREGSFWVGTDAGGLHRFGLPKLLTYGSRQGLPHDNVLSIHEGPSGRLWIGTYGRRLVQWRDGVAASYSLPGASRGTDLASVYEDRAGTLWVGLPDGDLHRLRGGRLRVFAPRRGGPVRGVVALAEDAAGALWAGTVGQGLYRIEGEALARYTRQQGLADDTVFCMAAARDGGLWVGTRRGLGRWHGGRFTVQALPAPAAERSVVSLLEDREGTLWVGTYGAGLYRVRGGAAFGYTTRQGLFNDVVFHVLDDGRGSLWMSCNKGIFRVRKAELEAVAEGRAARLTSTVLARSDGMRSVECNGASQPGAWRARDGRLWFPTVAGAVVVDPRRLEAPRNLRPPPVHIEGLRADGRGLPVRDGLRIPPGRGALELQYTALSLVAPEKVRFRYRLEGFDAGWVEAGTARAAYYTNIPPGRYRFQVAACNDEGVWNEAGASLAFRLEPRIDQTPWFRGLPFLGLAAIAWLAHRFRTQRLRTQSAVLRERNRIARDIHDGLAQALTGIALQLEAADDCIRDDAASAQAHIARARSWARASLAEARRAVGALRHEVLSTSGLLQALSRAAQQLAGDRGIRIEVRGAPDARPLPPEVGGNLYRIGQEALTNAVRYAEPRHILLELVLESRRLRLRVRDDGRGFDPEQAAAAGGGFGLRGMRERAEALGGGLAVRSRPGEGTDVVAHVPFH